MATQPLGHRNKPRMRPAAMEVRTHEVGAQSSAPSRVRGLLPLVLATMASQALLVVLSPTIVGVGQEFGVPVGLVGQARSVLAAAAIATSLGIAPLLDRLGVRPLLLAGALLAIIGSTGAALSPSLMLFLCVHAVSGISFACLLSAGFAGVASFSGDNRAWAMGYVVGANALAWILVNPLAGALTETVSWRAAHAAPAAIAFCVLATARATPDAHAPATAGGGLFGVLADPSARRWILAEMISFFAWGTYLTFVGAYFVQVYNIGESVTGIVLALGAGAFFATSVRGARFLARLPRPRVVAVTVLVMGALIYIQFATDDLLCVGFSIFFLCAATGGIRSAVASTLGLAQLPRRPGSMMAARTAANQMGYLLGGVIGGATLALGGYASLGIVLSAGLILGAAFILRVTDPLAQEE
jgi:predicted MFS family arabinose efflux permease